MRLEATIGETGLYRVGAKNEDARAKTVPALYSQIMYITPMFYKAGFQANNVLTYAIAQMMMESDWMTSNVANTDNNYSGITWINKPYQHATKGLPMPGNEGKGFYAHFDSFQEWADDFYRILNLNTGGQGKPIDAASAQQYVDRLKANGYFTSSNYYTPFNAALKKVNEALSFGQGQDAQYKGQAASGQDTFTVTAGKGLTSNAEFNAGQTLNKIELWAKDHPWEAAGAGVAALLLISKILR